MVIAVNTMISTIKAEKPSVCPSVCTFWHADISAVSAQIETGLAQNESRVFEDHKVYFHKPIVPTVHCT